MKSVALVFASMLSRSAKIWLESAFEDIDSIDTLFMYARLSDEIHFVRPLFGDEAERKIRALCEYTVRHGGFEEMNFRIKIEDILLSERFMND